MNEEVFDDDDVLDQLRILEAGWRGRHIGESRAFWKWWAQELERLWAMSELAFLEEWSKKDDEDAEYN